MNELRTRFGRPLRLAIVGGGPGAWIGQMHRTAAELDGYWRVVGGVFSSDAARSRSGGVALGFDAARSYGDMAALIDAEKGRPDGADAVAIMTPNDTHYRFAAAALDAGLDVVGDKPVTHDLAQARDLVARTKKNGRIYAIAHAYSAYPMTRHARHLVRDGAIGAVRLVQVEYIQSGLATRLEEGPSSSRLSWILDPQRSGLSLVMSAIGCHAQHLACFVSGLAIARVAADVGALLPGRKVVDYTSALMEFEGGARGALTVTQAAAGGENDIRLRVYGEKGLLDWSHRDASYLRLALQGAPARSIGRGDPGLPPEIIIAGRTPRGHPEGLREAFANIYLEVAQERMARTLGEAVPDLPYPRIEEGAHTMAFIEACLESQRRGGWVAVEKPA
ncbi:MAG: Gfo/Idh/MocA family oxidoreductase [Betaproteobacteria bacterium]